MPEFKKPKILKKADRIVSAEKTTCVDVSHLEYEFDGKLYPKLHISVFKQDSEGFPSARPKTINLPIELGTEISKAILSLGAQ